MIQSDKAKEQQEKLAKNLGKLFEGINSTGHKDMPKPLGEAAPAKEQNNKSHINPNLRAFG